MIRRFTGRALLCAITAVLCLAGCGEDKTDKDAARPDRTQDMAATFPATAPSAEKTVTDNVPGRIWADNPFFLRRKPYYHFDGHIIQDAKTFADLWRKWQSKPVPSVDFTRAFVIVATGSGYGVTRIVLQNREGDLKADVVRGSPSHAGFSWRIREVPSAGIRTINGKPLAARVVKAIGFRGQIPNWLCQAC